MTVADTTFNEHISLRMLTQQAGVFTSSKERALRHAEGLFPHLSGIQEGVDVPRPEATQMLEGQNKMAANFLLQLAQTLRDFEMEDGVMRMMSVMPNEEQERQHETMRQRM